MSRMMWGKLELSAGSPPFARQTSSGRLRLVFRTALSHEASRSESRCSKCKKPRVIPSLNAIGHEGILDPICEDAERRDICHKICCRKCHGFTDRSPGPVFFLPEIFACATSDES